MSPVETLREVARLIQYSLMPFDGKRLDECAARLRAATDLLAAERDEAIAALRESRKKMVDTFGGMGSGSAIWGQGQYEKGYTAGILAAVTAFDAVLAKAGVKP